MRKQSGRRSRTGYFFLQHPPRSVSQNNRRSATQLPPGSLEPSGNPPAAPGGCEEWPLVRSPFLSRSGELLRSPGSQPEAPPTKRRPARQGIASAWRSAEAAFVPRAQPLLVRPANPALLARPGAFPGPPPAVPAPSRSQYSATELSLLPSHSTSSTPRGVAPPRPQARPHQLPSLCSLFRSVSSHPAALALAPCRTARVSPASDGHLHASCPGGHSVCPLQLADSNPAPGRAP